MEQEKVLGYPYIKLLQEGSPPVESPSINMLAGTLHIGAVASFIRIDRHIYRHIGLRRKKR